MKYLIPIFTLILFLFGLLLFLGTLRFGGIGIYTPTLTILTFVGLLISIVNKKIGWTIILFATLGWFLRFSEYALFVLLYDGPNVARWVFVAIPMVISSILFTLIYRSRQYNLTKFFKLRFVILSILTIISIGLPSFAKNSHIKQFNCWYYFDSNKNTFKIEFAIAPKRIFETTSDSEDLKNLVLKYGLKDKFREGIYCPETKVEVIRRFNKITSIRILGFRNSTTNHHAILEKPVDFDIEDLSGDKQILLPNSILGD